MNCLECQSSPRKGETWLEFAEDGTFKHLCPACQLLIYIPPTRLQSKLTDGKRINWGIEIPTGKLESDGFLGF